MRLNILNLFIRALGPIEILYLLQLVMYGFGPGATPFLFILSFYGLFASGIGILFLKKWARYSSIIFLGIFITSGLYEGLIKYYKLDIVKYLTDGGLLFNIIPFMVIYCLFVPKIKKQFK